MEPSDNPKEASPKSSGEASAVFTIYCHVHRESGRRYVGQTKKTLLQRWNQHVYTSGQTKKKGWSRFANAIRKYGKDAFDHEVLEVCATVEEANLAEEKWISHFDTCNPEKGFNFKRGGDHRPHPVRNPWDRPDYAAANRGKNTHHLLTPGAREAQLASMRSPESRRKRSALTKESQARPEVVARQRELHDDPVYLARISGSLKESLSSPEAKARMSETTKSLHADPAYRDKVSSSVQKAYEDPEVRRKVSESSRRNWADPAYVEKQRSKSVSDETRKRLSEAATGRGHTDESKELQRRLYLERSSSCRFCGSAIDGKRTCIRGHVACFKCRGLHDAGRTPDLLPRA